MKQSAKTIIICANTSWYIYNFRKNTIITFINLGYNVVCLSGDTKYACKLEELGVVFDSFYLINTSTNPWHETITLISILKKIRRFKPDVILTFTPKVGVYASLCAIIKKVPFVMNVSGQGTVKRFRGFKRVIFYFMFKFISQRASRIYFQNPDDLAELKDIFSLENNKIELISGSGISLDEFSYQELANRKCIKFGLFSRLIDEKGVRYFLEAVNFFYNKAHLKFELAGQLDLMRKNPITEKEIEPYTNLANFQFLGFMEDCRPAIKDCDCIVLPSYYAEGTPRVLIEALAVGRPIITTDVAGCRETVNGENGYLITSNSASALIKAMDDFIQLDYDTRKKMGRKSRLLAENKFDEQDIISSYAVTLSKILN